MTTIAIAHPKGGVARSTTCFMLGVELARMHPSHAVVLHDHDQALHLTRMLSVCPPHLDNLICAHNGGALARASNLDVLVTLIDTAPEANYEHLRSVLARADWLLVPVKGPEAGSVQVLPQFLRWVAQQGREKLLGFVPTMYHPRRAETQRWLGELRDLADEHNSRVFTPIRDTAALAAWSIAGHPYAKLAHEVLDAIG